MKPHRQRADVITHAMVKVRRITISSTQMTRFHETPIAASSPAEQGRTA